ncbi:hypothetical protein SAMN05444170_4499 [Bradyrhizobium erythrophlei]|jgi:hypothetical protein|uniref:Uncharacterized protein n=1 Tax=Bradyrhizobium erythrophlei TaxID=1437360 RepID=A0A1M7UD45_9BRAD|nr:hypothetical protein SAMN05444170_4499 [Bradyrhizobium erythrophlei]
MCEKCVEIDSKIERYKRLARQMSDKRTLEGIDELIRQHEAEKTALHPKQHE